MNREDLKNLLNTIAIYSAVKSNIAILEQKTKSEPSERLTPHTDKKLDEHKKQARRLENKFAEQFSEFLNALALIKANHEEANSESYQDELSEWDNTLDDGL